MEGTESSPVGYLEGTFVLPEYRGQGVAMEMVQEVMKWGRE